jgi:hypothetical protein
VQWITTHVGLPKNPQTIVATYRTRTPPAIDTSVTKIRLHPNWRSSHEKATAPLHPHPPPHSRPPHLDRPPIPTRADERTPDAPGSIRGVVTNGTGAPLADILVGVCTDSYDCYGYSSFNTVTAVDGQELSYVCVTVYRQGSSPPVETVANLELCV